MELTQAEDSENFLMGDKKISNLQELLDALQDTSNEEAAKSHVAGDKNDYSNWISHVLKDEELAGKIADKKEISEIISVLQEKLTLATAETAATEPVVDEQPVAEQPATEEAQPSTDAPAESTSTEAASTRACVNR